VLLAKFSAGQKLTAEEKRKVRAQLVDLAKAVPALAIFAAPGGAILLPVLAKLLPFNLLPSAWDRSGQRPRPALPPAPSPLAPPRAEVGAAADGAPGRAARAPAALDAPATDAASAPAAGRKPAA
jgi:hypothetical protein